jgi:hypothetical protein
MKTLITFCLLLLNLNLVIAQQDEPIDEISDDWKGAWFFESSPFTSFSAHFSKHMERFIEQAGHDYSRVFQYATFRAGYRLQNTFFTLNVGTSMNLSEEFVNQHLMQGGLSLEQTIIKTSRNRFNICSGFNIYTHRIDIAQEEQGRTVDFRNALNERFRQVSFINVGPALNFGIGIYDRERRRRSLGSSVRMGYLLGLQSRTWEGVTVQLNNAPQDRFGMVYLEGNIMLSRNFKKR